MSRQLVIKFPVDLPDLEDKEALKKVKETYVLELLREKRISQGKAAELLEISRQDLFDLMAKYDIPMSDFPPEELKRQREEMKKAGVK